MLSQEDRNIYKSFIYGNCESYVFDKRVKKIYKNDRFNISTRDRKMCITSTNINDVIYLDNMICRTCNLLIPKKEFENFAIRSTIRKNTGFNLHCRKCSKNSYTYGYKIDEFIVPSEKKEENDEYEDEHEDEYEDKNED